jgi:geranylgeranyl diphosphate synthase type I
MDTMSSVVGDSEKARSRTQNMNDHTTFERFVADVRAKVDGRLAWWLDGRLAEARARGADVAAVADAVRQLVLRGGKRMRAALLAAAYEGCEGQGGVDAVLPAGAALELLQAYLLAHDDWMDGDDVRRGGPSVPAVMQSRFGTGAARSSVSERADPSLKGRGGSERGQDLVNAASVLAGDLAAGWTLQSMLELALPPARVVQAMRELGRVEEEVVHGQVLDVCGGARDASEVEALYALKTASYTVRCPIVMGARLAGADDAKVATLSAFAEPLGVAFQLRDDLLGTFGDTHAMGKPSGSDLRRGKRTALVVEAMRDPETGAQLARVLGRKDASEEEIAEAVVRLEASGARERVEERILTLVHSARSALERACLTPCGLILLSQAVVVLTERDR